MITYVKWNPGRTKSWRIILFAFSPHRHIVHIASLQSSILSRPILMNVSDCQLRIADCLCELCVYVVNKHAVSRANEYNLSLRWLNPVSYCFFKYGNIYVFQRFELNTIPSYIRLANFPSICFGEVGLTPSPLLEVPAYMTTPPWIIYDWNTFSSAGSLVWEVNGPILIIKTIGTDTILVWF